MNAGDGAEVRNDTAAGMERTTPLEDGNSREDYDGFDPGDGQERERDELFSPSLKIEEREGPRHPGSITSTSEFRITGDEEMGRLPSREELPSNEALGFSPPVSAIRRERDALGREILPETVNVSSLLTALADFNDVQTHFLETGRLASGPAYVRELETYSRAQGKLNKATIAALRALGVL